MTLSQRLDLKVSQSLVMTPQLQQAIKLLQLSNQDLCAFVASEIDKNPFLEHAEEQDYASSSPAAPGQEAEAVEIAPQAPSGAETDNHDSEPAQDQHHDTYDSRDQGPGHDPSAASDWTETIAERPSLRQHLLAQIHMDFQDPGERMIAAALMELLDEAGYLPQELNVFRSQLGIEADVLESIIQRLQRLDPTGIFARSLKECLSIQLREKNRFDPAMEKLIDHLELVAKHDHAALMRLCAVDGEDLAEMIAEIRRLTPRPAISFEADVSVPIVPDVLLSALPGGGWHIELNNETMPRVLINELFYTKLVEGKKLGPEKSYVSEQWQQANWLVKALQQRATTILKVATEIVKRQENFFVYGVQHLKPLILRDIAEAIEMHESTVSRVTQNKYITTPRGLFELKYFFTNALPTTGGAESVSTIAVRERIKALIDAEEPSKPLSDDRLMELLKAEGIDIARRTVAKYREGLHIGSSAQRRREKKAF